MHQTGNSRDERAERAAVARVWIVWAIGMAITVALLYLGMI